MRLSPAHVNYTVGIGRWHVKPFTDMFWGMNEFLADVLKWLGAAIVLGFAVWIQRKLFGPGNRK